MTELSGPGVTEKHSKNHPNVLPLQTNLLIVYINIRSQEEEIFHERRKWKLSNRKKRAKGSKGPTALEADNSGKFSNQEEDDLVVLGADMEGLYPSLPDMEVAIIVYKTVLETGSNIIN